MEDRKWGDGGDRCNLCGVRAAVSSGLCAECRHARIQFGSAEDVLVQVAKDGRCKSLLLKGDTCKFGFDRPQDWCGICKAKEYVVFLNLDMSRKALQKTE